MREERRVWPSYLSPLLPLTEDVYLYNACQFSVPPYPSKYEAPLDPHISQGRKGQWSLIYNIHSTYSRSIPKPSCSLQYLAVPGPDRIWGMGQLVNCSGREEIITLYRTAWLMECILYVINICRHCTNKVF